jgi:hypothetical protein
MNPIAMHRAAAVGESLAPGVRPVAPAAHGDQPFILLIPGKTSLARPSQAGRRARIGGEIPGSAGAGGP